MNTDLDFARVGVPNKNIILDKKSDKDFGCPRYRRLCRKMKLEYVFFIKSIYRLGRNYSEIPNQCRYLTAEKKVAIAVLDMPLLDIRKGRDLTGAHIADIILQLLSYLA